MSKDVANIIYDLAKHDQSLTGLTLQEMYKEKSKQDATLIKEKLYNIIKNHIKTTIQPGNNSIELTNDMIEGGNFKTFEITSSLVGLSRNLNGLNNKHPRNDEYTFYDEKQRQYYQVKDADSKHLIKHAIIPLNLKWHGKYVQDPINAIKSHVIVVKWDHWSYK